MTVTAEAGVETTGFNGFVLSSVTVGTSTSLDVFPTPSTARTTILFSESAVKLTLKLQLLLLTVAEPNDVVLSAIPSLLESI